MHASTDHFVSARRDVHRDENVEPPVELFSNDATLIKAGTTHNEGVRTFWTRHREVFDEIDASLRQAVTDDGIAMLGVDLPRHPGGRIALSRIRRRVVVPTGDE